MSDNVKPWDLLNPNQPRTPEEIRNNRLDICNQCPFFVKTTTTCKKCGCFMKLKTLIEKASCPIGKW